MRLSRSLTLLSLVAAATGGIAIWSWPTLGPALEAGAPLVEAAWPVLATAFGGLLLVHLHALIRLSRLAKLTEEAAAAPERQTAAAGGSRLEKPRKAPKATRSKPKKAPDSAPSAKAPRPEAEAPYPDVTPGRVVVPSGGGGDDPEKVEEFLKVVLEDADAEDVSFLPPYASDEPDEASLLDPYTTEDIPVLPGDEVTDREGAGGEPPGEAAAGEREGAEGAERRAREGYRNVPIPRHFALGTVAIIRQVLTPAEVAQVLVEQRKRPREKFGELAVEMGLLAEEELGDLLLAQQQGLFTDEEIREARSRIKSFRELEAAASAE